MKNFLYIFSIFFLGTSAISQNTLDSLLKKYNSGDVPYISVEELKMDQLKGEVVILDAREEEEFLVSHLQNSIYVGYEDFDISRVNSVPKDKRIVVYCSLGIRSEDIAKKLQKAGYRKVENLYGGIFEWKNNGFPVFDLNDNPTEKVHAFSEKWGKWLKNAEKVY